MNQIQLINSIIMETWSHKNFTAIEQCFSDNILYDGFMEKTVGKKNVILTIKKFLSAFSEITIKIHNSVKKNGAVCVTWSGSTKHINMFYGLQPSNKKFQFNVIGFYKIENFLIVNIIIMSNIKLNIVKSGSFPSFIQHRFLRENNRNKILSLLRNIYNVFLTNQEIVTASLWVTGYSNKQSAKILGISPRTVEEYRTQIKTKLSVKDKKSLYVFIRHIGLVDLFFALSDQFAYSDANSPTDPNAMERPTIHSASKEQK